MMPVWPGDMPKDWEISRSKPMGINSDVLNKKAEAERPSKG